MESNTHGAKIQKDGRTYAIQTYIPAGIVRPEDLEQIAHIAKKYKIPTIKITSGQRVLLIGVEEKDIGMIREELGQLGGGMFLPGVRIVQSCPGNAHCKNGTQDSLSLASALSNRYTEIKLPAKLKIGISGCPRCCGQSKVRDIGIVGSNNGWTVFFGGNSGYRCREGDTVVSGIQTGRTMELVDRLMTWYQSEAKEKERTARFMERVESDEVLKNEFSRIRDEFEITGCGTT